VSIIIELLSRIFLKRFPNFEDTLEKATIKEDVFKYLSKAIVISLIFSVIISIPFLFGFLKKGVTLLALIPIFLLCNGFIFWVFTLLPGMDVKKRKKEIESDLIYSLRHLLLKLQCNDSLLNSLSSTAMLPTLSSKYFAEVINNVNMGMPIDDAVDQALEYSPSDKFKTVMDEIKNSLKAGTNLKESLQITLKELTDDKIIEIKDYGKKLNPIAMFYMIIGTIIPSMGAAAFIVASSFVNVGEQFSTFLLIIIGVFLVIVQVFFYMLFSAVKPLASF